LTLSPVAVVILARLVAAVAAVVVALKVTSTPIPDIEVSRAGYRTWVDLGGRYIQTIH